MFCYFTFAKSFAHEFHYYFYYSVCTAKATHTYMRQIWSRLSKVNVENCIVFSMICAPSTLNVQPLFSVQFCSIKCYDRLMRWRVRVKRHASGDQYGQRTGRNEDIYMGLSRVLHFFLWVTTVCSVAIVAIRILPAISGWFSIFYYWILNNTDSQVWSNKHTHLLLHGNLTSPHTQNECWLKYVQWPMDRD